MNSAALKKAGMSKDMRSYMGKEIPKDSSGELTGETPDYPAGLFVVDKVVPPPTPAEEEQWIEAGQKQRNALGITSIRDLSNWPHAIRAFVRMGGKDG
jgi:predicted amidohydrolase YtcJ